MLHAGFEAENPIVTLHTNVGDIQVELYREEAPAGATRTTPITVANFLKYVNDGDWINSFFHRSRDNFVLQGGGFTTSQQTFQNLDQFDNVPTDPAILNEPGNSNVRGTIAMARTSGVNSATSQFFFNLSNDNTFLDNVNQGFTVFGRVVGGTMSVVDAIAALDTYNLTSGVPQPSPSPPPANEPLYGFVPFTADPRGGNANAELIVIESITGTGVIHGTIYNDLNRDGDRDGNETGMSGVTVYVDANNNGVRDGGELMTTSGADGAYHLVVASGTHVIRQVRPDGFGQSDPLNPPGQTVQVTIGGQVENVDFGNASALVGFRFETTDLAGNVRSNFQQGDNFLLKVYVQDLRGAGATRGVGAAYLDVLYNNNGRVAVNGPISFGPDYDESQSGVTSTAGIINEAGAATFDPAFLGAGEKLLFTVPMSALAAGEATFTGDPADNLPLNETLLQEPTQSVTAQNQFFGAHTITIGQQLAANNDGPIAIVKDSSNNTIDVLANDVGVANALIFAIVQNASHGSAVIAGDGRSILYTPTAGYVGPDSFQYSIRDTVTQEVRSATVTIDVNAADFPAAVDDTFVRILQNAQAISLNVLGNDLKASGTTLSITAVTQPGSGSPRVTIHDNGTPGNTADDVIRYTPPSADFVGTETFTYTISDGEDSDTATVTLQTIRAANDTFTVNEDAQGVTFDVTQNDTSPLSLLPSPTISFVGDRSLGGSVQIITVAGEQRLRYEPAPNAFGTETFIYRISDGAGNQSEATVTVTIQPANDSPTARDDSGAGFTVAEDSGDTVFHVMQNDDNSPDEAGTETLTITNVQGLSATNAQGATVAFSGTVTISNNGTRITYRPAPNFVGTETFEYTISDGKTIVVDGQTVPSADKATVTVTVTAANDNPTAVNDTASAFKNGDTQTIQVLANDSFAPDVNETLTVTGVSGGAQGAVISVATGGGAVNYKPAPGFSGQDTFTYTISDGRGGTAQATVTVTVSDTIPGTITGYAFFDADQDGLMDDGEAPLSGVAVSLSGTPDGASQAITRSTRSDASGRYEFRDLPPGTYTVTQSQPTTLVHQLMDGVTFAASALSRTVDVEQDEDVAEANFTQASRQLQYIGARDWFGRANGDVLDISFDSSGNTIWYSMGDAWDGWSAAKVEMLAGGRVRLKATNASGAEQSAIIRLSDAFHIRPFDVQSSTRIVQFLGGPSELGLSGGAALAQSSLAAPDSALAVSDSSFDESAGDEELLDDSFDDTPVDEGPIVDDSAAEGEPFDGAAHLADVDGDLLASPIVTADATLQQQFSSAGVAEGEPTGNLDRRLQRRLARLQRVADEHGLPSLSRLENRFAKFSSQMDVSSFALGEGDDSAANHAEGIAASARQRIERLPEQTSARRGDFEHAVEEAKSRASQLREEAASFAEAIAAAVRAHDHEAYQDAVDSFFADLDLELPQRLQRLARRR